MSNLTQRIAFGLPLAFLVLAALYFGEWYWLVLLILTGVLMSFEWTKLVQLKAWKATGIALGLTIFSALQLSFFYNANQAFLISFGLAILSVIAGALAHQRALKMFGYGLLYIFVPLSSLLWLRNSTGDTGLIITIWLVLIIWFTDIFAYFTGKTLGGPKIFPKVSPKKTWSGFIGGLIGAGIASFLVQSYFNIPEFAWRLIALALFVSAIGQLGDALESSIKRQFDVKDSGSLIPGHGGLFDRLDAFLVAAPAIYISLLFADADIMRFVGDSL